MPVAHDHPIRRIRTTAGITQPELARLAGVTRPLIAAIEEGRIKNPTAAVVEAAAVVGHTTPRALRDELDAWWNTPLILTPIARNVVSLPAIYISRYQNFTGWREDIAPSVTALASMLRISRAAVADYENGRQLTMSGALENALRQRLGVGDDYMDALKNLGHNYDPRLRRRRSTPFDGMGRGTNADKASASLAAQTHQESRP